MFRRDGAFAGLFTAAKELKRAPSFEVELDIDSSCLFASEFSKAVRRYGRTCRRDRDSRWGTFRDTEDSNRYLEMLLVNSWGEHLRQHERLTKVDRELEERIRSYTLREPTVRHLIYAARH